MDTTMALFPPYKRSEGVPSRRLSRRLEGRRLPRRHSASPGQLSRCRCDSPATVAVAAADSRRRPTKQPPACFFSFLHHISSFQLQIFIDLFFLRPDPCFYGPDPCFWGLDLWCAARQRDSQPAVAPRGWRCVRASYNVLVRSSARKLRLLAREGFGCRYTLATGCPKARRPPVPRRGAPARRRSVCCVTGLLLQQP